MGRFDFTGWFYTAEISSECDNWFFCNTRVDCVADSKQHKIMGFSLRVDAVKKDFRICSMFLKSETVRSQRHMCRCRSAHHAGISKISSDGKEAAEFCFRRDALMLH